MRGHVVSQGEREIVAFLASGPSPEAIIAFRLTPEVEDRCYELIYAGRERTLTDAEEGELDDYLYLNHLMIMIKAEARRLLENTAPPR